ncbi:MAG: hypothetical protein CR997_06955 [Acidobacteria bacterium]|nr:MAG: hypothetical protein CR997_06955 [Acidobacteriota bacterium]
MPKKFSPLKILVLNYEYPPIGGGGGTVCKNLAEELAERGHEVRVQTSWVKGVPGGLAKKSRTSKLTVTRLFSFRRKMESCTVWEMFLYLFTHFIPALKQAVFWKPDVIHAHFAVPTGVLAFVTSVISRRPYVLTIHLGDVPGALPAQTDHLFRFLKPFTFPIWKKASRIVAVSDFVKDLAKKAYGVPVETIYNGIRPITRTRKTGKRFQFISVGRFNEQKNLDFMFHLLAELEYRDWNYVLVGDGPLRKHLETKALKLGIDKQVHFTGWLSRECVHEKLSESHLLLIPSHTEGLPMVGIEALFLGTPILGSEIRGLRDLIDNGKTGYLLPLQDKNLWMEKLSLLISQRQELEEMSRKSRIKASQFDITKIAEAYEELFRNL